VPREITPLRYVRQWTVAYLALHGDPFVSVCARALISRKCCQPSMPNGISSWRPGLPRRSTPCAGSLKLRKFQEYEPPSRSAGPRITCRVRRVRTRHEWGC
jgi:hypothetical protein